MPPLHVLSDDELSRVERCVDFINSSPDPFHCVHLASEKLQFAGFQQLEERDLWKNIVPGGKYFFTRDGSSLVAFTVGKNYQPGNGFKIMCAHTDSPNLKIKPIPRRGVQGDLVQLNVEPYGGGLWSTWFDRDLSLSGRVIIRNRQDQAKYITRLVKIDRPILHIPSLCIHLRTQAERENMSIHKENHLIPILCNAANTSLAARGLEIQSLLAETIGCDVSDIVDFELSLFDTHKASKTGLFSDFICGSRLDNLVSCFLLLETLSDHAEGDEDISMVALFDHEEVGSTSAVGAGSPLIEDAIQRIMSVLQPSKAIDCQDTAIARAKSFILSVDMAHAIHPNFPNKHDGSHTPRLNHGVVVKSNVNQRYATTATGTAVVLREIARGKAVGAALESALPLQDFAVRNDCPCGSTIGPM